MVKSDGEKDTLPYTSGGKIINSDMLNGMDVEKAKIEVIKKVENLKIGKKKFNIDLKTGVFLGKDIGVVQFQ